MSKKVLDTTCTACGSEISCDVSMVLETMGNTVTEGLKAIDDYPSDAIQSRIQTDIGIAVLDCQCGKVGLADETKKRLLKSFRLVVPANVCTFSKDRKYSSPTVYCLCCGSEKADNGKDYCDSCGNEED